MKLLPKSLMIGCALALAACAQNGLSKSPGTLGSSGLSALPGAALVATAGGRTHPLVAPAIYLFTGQPDANGPQTGMARVGSTFYGTTANGGASNEGALYSVTTSGAETVAHSFPTGANDGIYPEATVTAVNGTLYGTAFNGGTNGDGILFSMTPSGTYAVLYNFGSTSSDCMSPDTPLTYVKAENALYGAAYHGGTEGDGCIFKYSLGTNPGESVLYSFTGSQSVANGLVYYNGALFGTTQGGGSHNLGAIFRVGLTGTERLIYSFKNAPDGSVPQAGLVAVGNKLYGTTVRGGNAGGVYGCGTVYSVTPGGTETVLHIFPNDPKILDGCHPHSALIAVGGTLYGVTADCSGTGCGGGVVYSETPGGSENVVYDFPVNGNSPPGVPYAPIGSLLSYNGMLYGTTVDATGSGYYGSVFALAP